MAFREGPAISDGAAAVPAQFPAAILGLHDAPGWAERLSDPAAYAPKAAGLTPLDADVLGFERDPPASAVADLARHFTALVRASGVGRTATEGRDAVAEFGAWIASAKVCSAPAEAEAACYAELEATPIAA